MATGEFLMGSVTGLSGQIELKKQEIVALTHQAIVRVLATGNSHICCGYHSIAILLVGYMAVGQICPHQPVFVSLFSL